MISGTNAVTRSHVRFSSLNYVENMVLVFPNCVDKTTGSGEHSHRVVLSLVNQIIIKVSIQCENRIITLFCSEIALFIASVAFFLFVVDHSPTHHHMHVPYW